MPGLYGIVAKTPDVSPERLHALGRRMADTMRRAPWLRAELWATDWFCGGRVDPGVLGPAPQPLVTPDRLTRVWFDGEYRLSPQGGLGTPTAEGARALLAGDRPSIAAADGVFAMALVHADGSFVLANDRLGYRPIYYTETPEWFAYAGEVKALLAIRDRLPDIDETGLRQYFGFDHMLGDRTWWRDISLLPPASIWQLAGPVTRRTQYWSFDDLPERRCSLPEAQAEFGRLWDQAVRDHRRPGTTPVLLSGGLDSRLLVAELLSQDAPIVAVTYGSQDSPEVGPARAVARIAGIEHRVCEWTTRNWWQGREQAIWQTDGLVNANHLHPAIAVEEMRVGTCYSPMNMVGDLLFGGSHLAPQPWHELREEPASLMRSRFVLNPLFGVDEVLEASQADIRRYAGGPSSDCFHLRQRYRRYVLHSPGCFAPYCETVFPGAGYEFLQLFLATLTEEDRRNHKFYNAFLADRHPRFFANLPWQATGRGLRESRHVRAIRSLRRRGQRLLRIPRKKTPSNKWFVDYPAAVTEHRVRERLLGQDLLIDDVLKGAARRALLKHPEQPLAAESIIAMLTFETYLRQAAAMPRLTLEDERGTRLPRREAGGEAHRDAPQAARADGSGLDRRPAAVGEASKGEA